MRTITNLTNAKKHIYVKLGSKELCRQFMLQAEWEGFTVGDSGKPTDIEWTDIIAVYPNKKLCRLGRAGHMLYHAKHKNVVRVDYEKYINGHKRYLISEE